MTDKDAMEKAASEYEDKIDRAHGRHWDCCYSGYDVEKSFEAGWQAALKGPKVLALVNATQFLINEVNALLSAHGAVIEQDYGRTNIECVTFRKELASQALAEFEGEK